MQVLTVIVIALFLAAVTYFVLQMTETSIPTTGTLNAQQIAQLAANAGFTGSDLATAVAIALAESGGKAGAYNPEVAAGTPTGLGSYGLWQIYEKAHPEYTAAQLLDPQTNANAAYKVYVQAGDTFTPWSTYNGGQYQNYAQAAQDATGQQVS